MDDWPSEFLKEAVELKLPGWFKAYNGRSLPRMTLLESCSCGSDIYCCQADMGHVDYDPVFAHICENPSCNFLKVKGAHGVSFPDEETNSKYCGICKKVME